MNFKFNKKVIAAVIVTTIVTTTAFITSSADGTAPGSEADPVVTQSYVELKSEQTKYYIDSLIVKSTQEMAALKTQLDQKNQEILKLQESVTKMTQEQAFVVVELPAGKTLLSGAGAEVIVRSGQVTAIKGVGGGLANITSGKDLNTGDVAAPNNLLISSRDDGRGIKAVTASFLLVRGAYTLK